MKNWLIDKGGGYVVVQFILFGLIYFLPNPQVAFPAVLRWAAVPLLVYGGVMIALGLLHLGRNLTAVPTPKTDSSLVVTGAYALVRHPIYSGIIIGAIGLGLWRLGLVTLFFALLLIPFFDIKSRREERLLSAMFAEYATYKKKVSKLIPFIY